jgi:hypothetical protein
MSRKQTVLRTKTLPSTLNLNTNINKIKKIENIISNYKEIINYEINKNEEPDIVKQENLNDKKKENLLE